MARSHKKYRSRTSHSAYRGNLQCTNRSHGKSPRRYDAVEKMLTPARVYMSSLMQIEYKAATCFSGTVTTVPWLGSRGGTGASVSGAQACHACTSPRDVMKDILKKNLLSLVFKQTIHYLFQARLLTLPFQHSSFGTVLAREPTSGKGIRHVGWPGQAQISPLQSRHRE